MSSPDFKIVAGGSKKGRDLLVDKRGRCYSKDGTVNTKGYQRWRCNSRTKGASCKGTVSQRGSDFQDTGCVHSCTPKNTTYEAASIRAQLKEQGKARPYTFAATLVREALDEHIRDDKYDTVFALPTVDSLVRATNLARQRRRPKHPQNLDFEFDEDAIPEDFVQADVSVGPARHIILFTTFLMSLLCSSLVWYVDGTFKDLSVNSGPSMPSYDRKTIQNKCH